MGYRLGVDVGTTYTVTATCENARVEMVGLGNRALQIPSVAFVQPDGEVIVGEAAEQHGPAEPGRCLPGLQATCRRTRAVPGGGQAVLTQSFVGRLLAAAVWVTTERQGSPPEHVTVTHPADRGAYKIELLHEAAWVADVTDASFCTEPEAAAIQYASRNRLPDGEMLAVYDLGGGRFDAAVLRRTGDRFELLGSPEGIEHLGGVDFDEAVFQHVTARWATACARWISPRTTRSARWRGCAVPARRPRRRSPSTPESPFRWPCPVTTLVRLRRS